MLVFSVLLLTLFNTQPFFLSYVLFLLFTYLSIMALGKGSLAWGLEAKKWRFPDWGCVGWGGCAGGRGIAVSHLGTWAALSFVIIHFYIPFFFSSSFFCHGQIMALAGKTRRFLAFLFRFSLGFDRKAWLAGSKQDRPAPITPRLLLWYFLILVYVLVRLSLSVPLSLCLVS